MGDDERKRMEKAGAFIGDCGINAPVPIRTLSDDDRDVPEPEDSDRVPDPEPEGLVTRVAHALTGKHPHERD